MLDVTMPAAPHVAKSDYARIAHAIAYLRANARAQPSLEEVAAELGLSPFHFQRLFQRWAGVSPKRFLQVVTLTEAKRLLEASHSVLDASVEVGLSGPSRLHDLFLSVERMTPGEYKARAKGLRLAWSVESTPLGDALLVSSPHGLCGISFIDEGGRAQALEELRARWPEARFVHAPEELRTFAGELRARMTGAPARSIGVVLKGTPLQLKVWEALLSVPAGAVATYGDLAAMVGSPTAVRAVASAVAANPLGYLIPCHRVIRASGVLGEYHWGSERKQVALALDQINAG